jgi:hypothetical protein
MKIIWDPIKASSNSRTHGGVTFEEAQGVLLDPFALTREDDDAEGEQRFVSPGMGGKDRIGRGPQLSQRNDPHHFSLEGEHIATETL